MTLLGIDIGTTHCKAGLFSVDGETLKIVHHAHKPQIVRDSAEYSVYDPDLMWETVRGLVSQAAAAAPDRPIRAVGIASMAESGLLIDRASGQPRSPILPWFDGAAQPQADRIAAAEAALDFYLRTGLHVSAKLSLAKLLWLRDRNPAITDGAMWLSVADYIAYKLTGAAGTDYSLAGRTGAFDVARQQWDSQWLARWELRPDHFAPAQSSGTPVGGALAEHAAFGIPRGTPVAVSGHDHLCAAALTDMEELFDSMGTAEVMIGSYPARPLTQDDFDSGLSRGCHVAAGRHYWLGSLAASGGSIEWLRQLLSAPALSYDDLNALAESAANRPTGVLYFPYLAGSGAPHSNPAASGAFIGLRARHSRADITRAVLEGTAYEMEYIRRAGENMKGSAIRRLTAAGGGARSRVWLQIKADISGCDIHIPAETELSLRGAALMAAAGSALEMPPVLSQPYRVIKADAHNNARYHPLFDQYAALQPLLRRFDAYAKDHVPQ